MRNNSKRKKGERFDPAQLEFSRLSQLKDENMYQNLETNYDVKKGFQEWFEDFDQLEQNELRKRQLAKTLLK